MLRGFVDTDSRDGINSSLRTTGERHNILHAVRFALNDGHYARVKSCSEVDGYGISFVPLEDALERDIAIVFSNLEVVIVGRNGIISARYKLGAIPVGIRSCGDEDKPYWPQTNNACYKEVWVSSASKFLSLLSEY